MKIVLLNNLYGVWARGGAEKVVADLANALKSAGHQVFVITTTPKNKLIAEPRPDIYYLKSNYYNLAQRSGLYRFGWQLINIFNFKKYYQIKKIFKRIQPDLMIANNLMGLGFLIPKLSRRLKIKYVQILHDIQLLHPSGLMFYESEKIINNCSAKIYQKLIRCLFKSPSLVVSPSRWLLDLHLQKKFFKNSRTLILKNPTNNLNKNTENNFSEIKMETSLQNPDKFQLLYVGQIESHKGIIFLVKAFKKIADPKLKLLIAGTGSQVSTIQELVQSDQRIDFLGYQTESAVKNLMTTSQFLIIPSLVYENSPQVIQEALAANLPIIAANIGGIPEVANNSELLFKPGDETELINKVNFGIKNYSDIKNRLQAPLATMNPADYAKTILENLQ